MRIAIMQPYAFSFIGYFQLIAAVDRFILLDDVNAGRNRFMRSNTIGDGDFTLAVHGFSQNKQVRELELVEGGIASFVDRIAKHYAKSPYLADVMPLIDRRPLTNFSQYVYETLVAICNYLGIYTEIIPTSSVYNATGKGQDLIIDICKQERATTYINASGGVKLYDAAKFKEAGIKLEFMMAGGTSSNLSIIHLLMTQSVEEIRRTYLL